MAYAISFYLDTDTLAKAYPTPNWNNAYADIKKILEENGFTRQQGSVYFGNETVDAVKAVMATQRLTRKFSWFAGSVRDIRMLRIEDDNDLMPAINMMLDELTRE